MVKVVAPGIVILFDHFERAKKYLRTNYSSGEIFRVVDDVLLYRWKA